MLTPDIRETLPRTGPSGPARGPTARPPTRSGGGRTASWTRARDADGDVLLFSHGHLLRVLAARWIGLEAPFGRLFSLSTGTLSVLGWDRENRVVETWNEACHLTDLAGLTRHRTAGQPA